MKANAALHRAAPRVAADLAVRIQTSVVRAATGSQVVKLGEAGLDASVPRPIFAVRADGHGHPAVPAGGIPGSTRWRHRGRSRATPTAGARASAHRSVLSISAFLPPRRSSATDSRLRSTRKVVAPASGWPIASSGHISVPYRASPSQHWRCSPYIHDYAFLLLPLPKWPVDMTFNTTFRKAAYM